MGRMSRWLVFTGSLILSSWQLAHADPTWTVTEPSTGSLQGPFVTATRLQDDRILVIRNNSEIFLYDSEANTWTTAANASMGKQVATATLLQDGRVLTVGEVCCIRSSLVEIYQPSSNTWTVATSMGSPRLFHTATRLSDGQVLVVGGQAGGDPDAELYTPGTNTWSPAANLNIRRVDGHVAVLLQDGRLLVAGGQNAAIVGEEQTVELYNPTTNIWTQATSMAGRRFNGHTATLLSDGRVLIVGGGEAGSPDAEIYDPSTNTWTATTAMAYGSRRDHTTALLSDNTVLVSGGSAQVAAGSSTTAEIYHPDLDLWVPTVSLNVNRNDGSAVPLADGGVLIVGGTILSDVASGERFDSSPVVGGGRGAVDEFLAWNGAPLSRSTTIVGCSAGRQAPLVIHSALNGETINTNTFALTLNGTPITPVSPLPVQGTTKAVLTLAAGRNVVLGSIDGLVPGTTRTATDNDRLTIDCQGL